jgi:SET domain-containing protein
LLLFSCCSIYNFISFSLLCWIADQPLQKGDVVSEYVGEYVTPAVTDARDKIYQKERIQDYQFRIDSQIVIDATKRGGHGRYANHNCDPNCATKIIPFNMADAAADEDNDYFLDSPDNSSINSSNNKKRNLKRVVIVAQRDIEPMEELTYDYQFPLEIDLEERIPCNCNAKNCRGFMNWDLPEKGANTSLFRTQKRGANMRDRIRRLGRPLKGDK